MPKWLITYRTAHSKAVQLETRWLWFQCAVDLCVGPAVESTDSEPVTSRPITVERSQLLAWQVFTSSWQTTRLCMPQSAVYAVCRRTGANTRKSICAKEPLYLSTFPGMAARLMLALLVYMQYIIVFMLSNIRHDCKTLYTWAPGNSYSPRVLGMVTSWQFSDFVLLFATYTMYNFAQQKAIASCGPWSYRMGLIHFLSWRHKNTPKPGLSFVRFSFLCVCV